MGVRYRDSARKPYKMSWNVSGTSSRRLTSTKFCVSYATTLSVSVGRFVNSRKKNFFDSNRNWKKYFAVTVVVMTAIFWIPASCIISFFDRKKLRQQMKEFEWSQTLDLIHPSDRRRVIHIRYLYTKPVHNLCLCWQIVKIYFCRFVCRVPRQKITVARM